MTVIRGRAPLRLGLGGGGTDVSPYSEKYGGRVLNVTIDKYAYAYAESSPDGLIRFDSPDRQRNGSCEPADVDGLSSEFGLHVAVYRRMIDQFNNGEDAPVSLVTQVDAPPGSGLGSSSAVVVAMVVAFAELLKVSLGQYELARLAWEIERQDLGLAGGWQDHYAAVFGGFNYMESHADGRVVVNPLRVRRDVRSELEASLLLYFGGVSRDSADVIAEQQRNVITGQVEAIEATHAIRWEARTIKDHLVTGDIAGIAQSLRGGWEAKKKLATQISNPVIERAYEVATEHGMIAGKVSGAGGGGFMMMLVDPRRRLEITQSLERDCGGAVLTCHFTDTGVESWRSPSGLHSNASG